jgi:tetratricopeptide (TPR) repeat protein
MYSLHAGPDGRRRAGVLAASVLRDDPDNADARYVWSRTLSDREEYEAALVLAEQLVAEGHPHAHDALLVAHSGLGDHEAALATIERALAAEPDAPMYLRGKACCLRFLDRPREALAVARYAARISPATPDLQLQLGLAARTVGDVAAAEHALRLAVEQAPGTGEPVAELAMLYVDAERWDDAEELMDRLRPDLPDPREAVLAASTLATAYLQRAFPALGELDEDDPAPGPLAVAAGFLGRAIDMYAVAAVGYSGGPAAFAELIGEVHGVLHEVAAPADSSFAAVVRRLDALVRTWRSGRPYESDIVEELS